tara:strand:+ start:245 stop:658 length:414 start_codon:yes stop_codon:yes gene_type:complete
MSAINTSMVNSVNVNRADNTEKYIQAADSTAINNSVVEIQAEKKKTESVNNSDNLAAQEKGMITSEQLERVAQKLQDFVGEMNKGLEFSVDKDSGRDVIKVIDKNSGDLIKQYPTEEVLDLVAKLSEATGNFINTDV